MMHKQKTLSPIICAVKRKIPLLCFALVLLALTMTFVILKPLASAAAANRQAVQEALDKTSQALDAAEPIYQKLRELIEEEVDAMGVEDDSEPDLDESEAGYLELNGYAEQLDGLILSLNGLTGDPSASDGKTVRAAIEYLSMLRDMSSDLSELVRYGIDMYHAVEPMGMMDGDSDDFAVIAAQIWNGCEATRVMMEAIKPPSYLAITHNDLVARITEFRDFGEDFKYACSMEDPLRMYSCVYQTNRIIRMFDICDDNLTSDMDLQFTQAERRLNGPIAQLRDELMKNIETLNNALGRGQ